MISKEEILKYLKLLKSQLKSQGIIRIGLFGSFAKGTNNKNSDIDIVYETSEDFLQKYPGWNAFTFLNENLRDKIANKFNVKVDLFDLNSQSEIKEKIKKEAIYV